VKLSYRIFLLRRQSNSGLVDVFKLSCVSEVAKLNTAVAVEQDVCGLDVAVNDACRVN